MASENTLISLKQKQNVIPLLNFVSIVSFAYIYCIVGYRISSTCPREVDRASITHPCCRLMPIACPPSALLIDQIVP